MPTQIIERAPNESEKISLAQFNIERSSRTHLRVALEEALVLWFVLMGCFLILWKLVSWLAAKLDHVNFGFSGPHVLPTLVTATLLFIAIAAWNAMRRMRAMREKLATLRQDLEREVVLDERHFLIEAKRFQEQEYGGLIYFFRTDENRVFVLYDSESQDLGARGEDPLTSSFTPCRELHIVRTPASRIVLSTQFSGDKLDTGEVWDLMVEPNLWPDDSEFCDCEWDELLGRYSSKQ